MSAGHLERLTIERDTFRSVAEFHAGRAQKFEDALREIARREYIDATTDGQPIDSPVHGSEAANAIASAALAGSISGRPPTTTNRVTNAAIAEALAENEARAVLRQPTPKFPECVQPTARGRSVLRPPTPEGGAEGGR